MPRADFRTCPSSRAALLFALVLGVVGCSSASSRANAPAPSAAVTTTTFPNAPAPQQFTGSPNDFYRVPSPLPPGRPGQLIRLEDVSHTATTRTVKLMYHSRDARNRDRAVTGTITFPTSAAPKGGWPVFSWAHGTTGLAPQCAPSRYQNAPAFGIQGVDVATDYIGLGPLGERHSYLSGPSEAHAVIDAVRAARNLTPAHAGKRWLALGHSQGGHSALFTNQLGASYAPELDLLGTVAFAPAAVLTKTFGPSDQVVPEIVGVMALYGLAQDHPDLHPGDYVGARAASVAKVLDTGCLNDIIHAYAGIPQATFYKVNPRTTEPARSILVADDPGHVRVSSPLLVVGGTADALVVPARVDALVKQLCSIGQVTQRIVVPGATHDTVVGKSAAQVTAWLRGRLSGTPAPDICTK